jgi:hypothetical protein
MEEDISRIITTVVPIPINRQQNRMKKAMQEGREGDSALIHTTA